jgi:Transposase DDE domain
MAKRRAWLLPPRWRLSKVPRVKIAPNSVLKTITQRRLDEHPGKMRQRRETVEHPFGTIKARMGATHFLTKTLLRVAAEMALHVLAYTLTRVINMIGPGHQIAAIRT